MVTLPGLETYSAEQLSAVRVQSSAFARYEQLLAKPEIDALHARRHQAWLQCVAAEILKTSSTADICSYWSQTADELLKEAWRLSELEGKEAVLIALGKHGSHELNLSSDIDVMVVTDPKAAADVEKGLRRFRQLLHQPGEFGFCYRLDFDLRPGGTMGPTLTTISQFQDYYWSQGETWERLALVRLRPIAGSPTLMKALVELANRFSFRKFLDFTLLEDLKALRAQVHQKGFDRRPGELHLKLEVGGIRDIELFVHSLLVLNGGKIPDLQTRSTTDALTRLKDHALLTAQEADFLLESYWLLRHEENLAQAAEDRQTHTLRLSPPRPDLAARMAQVNKIVSSLLGKVNLHEVRLPRDLEAQKNWLLGLGFQQEAFAVWEQLIKATALSHKNDRDERARQEFLFNFVTEISRHKELDHQQGLNLLLDFVRATRGKATFFSMLLRAPRLMQDLSRLFCISPYLGSLLVGRPELLDHFILRVDETWSADPQVLLNQMSERKLLTEVWAANSFLQKRDLHELSSQISQTADEIALELLKSLRLEFPQATLSIVALGKWGGQELGLRSDLDFIFVTPGQPQEADFKVARRFISRLTDPLRRGHLYDVDLRLRPSGQSGPLLVERNRLHEYWQREAQVWERQAYLRARALSGLSLEKQNLIVRPLEAQDLAELKRIREKLLQTPSSEGFDLKLAPGGLVDIELATQTAFLTRQIAPMATSTLKMMEQLDWPDKLASIYRELRQFEQLLHLTSVHKTASISLEHPVFIKASRLLDMSADQAWAYLQLRWDESLRLLKSVDRTTAPYRD